MQPAAPAVGLPRFIDYRPHDYDALLADGYERDAARFFVIDDMNAVLEHWGSARRVTGDADDGV